MKKCKYCLLLIFVFFFTNIYSQNYESTASGVSTTTQSQYTNVRDLRSRCNSTELFQQTLRNYQERIPNSYPDFCADCILSRDRYNFIKDLDNICNKPQLNRQNDNGQTSQRQTARNSDGRPTQDWYQEHADQAAAEEARENAKKQAVIDVVDNLAVASHVLIDANNNSAATKEEVKAFHPTEQIATEMAGRVNVSTMKINPALMKKKETTPPQSTGNEKTAISDADIAQIIESCYNSTNFCQCVQDKFTELTGKNLRGKYAQIRDDEINNTNHEFNEYLDRISKGLDVYAERQIENIKAKQVERRYLEELSNAIVEYKKSLVYISAQTDGNKKKYNQLKQTFGITDDDIIMIINEVDKDLDAINPDLCIERNNQNSAALNIAHLSKMGYEASEQTEQAGGSDKEKVESELIEEVVNRAMETMAASIEVYNNVSERDALTKLYLKYSNQYGSILPLAEQFFENRLIREKTKTGIAKVNLQMSLSTCAANE